MGYGQRQNSWWKFAVLFVLVAAAVSVMGHGKGKQRAVAGIPDPVQTGTTGQTQIFLKGTQLTVSYLYEYDIQALVVSTHNYSGSGMDDRISPRDLALAWGDVAAYNTIVDFHWNQSGRWYSWHVNTYEELDKVGGMQAVTEHSSNNHIIPANDGIKKLVKKIKVGDHVRLKGYLVNVDGKSADGRVQQWHSSTTRSDSGDHSCEVIYVTDVEWLD